MRVVRTASRPVDRHRPARDPARRQQQPPSGRDDAGERVHPARAEVGDRAHRAAGQVTARQPAFPAAPRPPPAWPPPGPARPARARPAPRASSRLPGVATARPTSPDVRAWPTAGEPGDGADGQGEGAQQQVGVGGLRGDGPHGGQARVGVAGVDFPLDREVRDRPPGLGSPLGDRGPAPAPAGVRASDCAVAGRGRARGGRGRRLGGQPGGHPRARGERIGVRRVREPDACRGARRLRFRGPRCRELVGRRSRPYPCRPRVAAVAATPPGRPAVGRPPGARDRIRLVGRGPALAGSRIRTTGVADRRPRRPRRPGAAPARRRPGSPGRRLDLSVSISAMTSPAATLSPGCLYQWVRTASVIAIPRAGIVTSCTCPRRHRAAGYCCITYSKHHTGGKVRQPNRIRFHRALGSSRQVEQRATVLRGAGSCGRRGSPSRERMEGA